MMISLYYSLCDYNILSAPVFVGLKNYIKMFSDEVFFKTIGVTFFYALISVPLRLAFALLVAMLLLNSSRLTAFYRAAYYLPSIIGGSVAVSILWKRMFAIDGVINKVLAVFGMKDPVSWLGDKNTAIWTLILLAVWQFGSSMLIFLSSLKQIPPSLYEAASIDGAGKFRQFLRSRCPC
ncbi:MAG: carbohydrate ABC transporter permease [Gemmiger formicilis]|uniref:carbohydrate ABC transporter permease n=1 Tax=Gemmiger formicilis TaxID=745368 RepID=UPI00399219E3